MTTILLVDDEARMLDLLSLYLSPNGYRCVKKTSALEAVKYLEDYGADLVLLDVMMPEMDGWELCREIRKKWDTPIIMLTARTEKPDVVKGFKMGADDYVTKPFDEDELLARIEAVLRRQKGAETSSNFNGLSLSLESHVLRYEGQAIALTPKEFSLIALFLEHKEKVFTREHLITVIWGYDVSTEDRTVDSHVRNLRDKLRKAGFPADEYLKTVWGTGYKWLGKPQE
ncbi:response regulator transcription factor [Mesobacillus zeae]|uniref:DNA-binding response regulator n=1 Tax=Mesobacillus zeae TaxID=1917180 RepID=A0A398B789_9BACI|nr:response regulator transcription factor [Mesobacillus zeae]RID83770.1 DNA-binding response regulator [Mesobacillus zeae]